MRGKTKKAGMKGKMTAVLLVPMLAAAGSAFWGVWEPTALLHRMGVGGGRSIGAQIDSLDGIAVYYNGPVGNVSGRNLAPDGYNLGQKYQCVEFVKRYYYEALDHKMPDSYGHAKDFFDSGVADGGMNQKRALLQYTNGGSAIPQPGDLLVFGPTLSNRHGHVAIVAGVTAEDIEYIQQNPGPSAPSREKMRLFPAGEGQGRAVDSGRLLGWLRKPVSPAAEGQTAAGTEAASSGASSALPTGTEHTDK